MYRSRVGLANLASPFGATRERVVAVARVRGATCRVVQVLAIPRARSGWPASRAARCAGPRPAPSSALAVGLRCVLGAAGRPHDTGPGPTSWAFVWAPHAPVSSWVIGSDHCQPGWSCNWHWTGVSPGGGVSGETSGRCFSRRGSREIASEQRFPQEGVSRGNRLGLFPPGGGLSGKFPGGRIGVSPGRGSLGEMPRSNVSPGGGLSGKCLGSTFPPGGGLSGKSPRRNASERGNVSPRRGSLGEMPRSVTLRPLAGAQAEPESARRRNSCRGRREAPEETLYCAVQIRARNTCLLYRRTKGRSTCSRRHA